MQNCEELLRENAALRERLSRLSQASVRITEDLDLDTVLQGVVDGARSLTGARIGGLTALDETGQLQAFITSGLTLEERRLFVELPGGPEFFAYLSRLPEPLRLADFSAYTQGMGLPDIGPPLGPVGSFLGAPLRLRGQHLGNLYLSGKEGSLGFTQEDEDTLVMFASQAALAIANARRHGEERQIRADLETLMNTAPVGVVVFDARTGVPLSINREARRIVDGLRNPDQAPEDLLGTLSFRRADGREISLEEFPLAQALSTGETVRAEEIVIQVPDGRRVTTIVNASPILSEDSVIESVIVTLQDMTPLEEMERQRAEFLGMVSHELRAPLTSIKGSSAAVLRTAPVLDPAEIQQFFRIIDSQADHMLDLINDLLDLARIDAGTLFLTTEAVEATVLVDRGRSTFLSGGGRNNLRIELPPHLPLVTADRRRIGQVLVNLLTNAARHSPESSAIRVSAARDGVHVAFSVADDGVGFAPERLPYLFRKFSGGDAQDSGSIGAGLGLAICRGIVEAHGGRIWAESGGPGLGTRFTFTLPAVEAADTLLPAGSPTRGRRRGRQRVRVLVVDDDPQTLRYVREALSNTGYDVVAADEPEEALRLVEEEKAPPGPAGPGAARLRRVGADAGYPPGRQHAGDLPVRLRAGPGDSPGLRAGGRRLYRQALLSHGTGGENPGGPATAGSPGAGGAAGTLRAGGPAHRLLQPEGEGGGPGGEADGHPVRPFGRAGGERGPGGDPRGPAAPGVGADQARQRAGDPHPADAAEAEAGGGRRKPHLHLRRAQGGV